MISPQSKTFKTFLSPGYSSTTQKYGFTTKFVLFMTQSGIICSLCGRQVRTQTQDSDDRSESERQLYY